MRIKPDKKIEIELTLKELRKLSDAMERYIENLYYSDKEAYKLGDDLKEIIKEKG